MSRQAARPLPDLSREQIERYRRDGFLVVPDLYSDAEMVEWKERIIRRMQEEGSIASPSGVRVWMPGDLDPYFRRKMIGSNVVRVLRALIGSDIEFLSVKPVFKNAHTDFASPWHQDWFYWRGSHKISVWIALDAADQTNGCLVMIPGSHRAVRPMTVAEAAEGFPLRVGEDELQGLPVQTLAVERGDAVFFHDLVLHASHPNTSGQDRWSLIPTYRDGSIRDEATVWQTPILVSGTSAHGAAPFGVEDEGE